MDYQKYKLKDRKAVYKGNIQVLHIYVVCDLMMEHMEQNTLLTLTHVKIMIMQDEKLCVCVCVCITLIVNSMLQTATHNYVHRLWKLPGSKRSVPHCHPKMNMCLHLYHPQGKTNDLAAATAEWGHLVLIR